MKKGFTLIEVIVALAIFTITFVAISESFSLAIKIKQNNDIEQNNFQFSEAIIEDFKDSSYSTLNSKYNAISSNGVSTFMYFNTINDLQNVSSNTISGNVTNKSLYPTSTGNKYGALISISKQVIGDISPYYINVRVWRLDQGSNSQSIKDFYESR